MSGVHNPRDMITKRRKKTCVFKHQYYQSQFNTEEQKIINESLNILSREYSQQKQSLNFDEAKFVCYYFLSIFEFSRREYSVVDKQLIQLYHDVNQMKEVRSVVDIILSVKKNYPNLQMRSLGQFSDNDIADNLSHKQILQIEKSWSEFDEEEEGFINSNDADLPVYHILANYGYDENHPNMKEIKEIVEQWKDKTSFYLFFNEFASLICEINNRFPLSKKNTNKQSCACNIF